MRNKRKKNNIEKVRDIRLKKISNASQNVAKENYPHFRYYKKSKHPALIIGEQVNEKKKEEYKFRKVMNSERDGRHLNEKIVPNPNPKDKEPMYIAHRVRHDLKTTFESKPLNWIYPKKNKK